MQCILFGTRSRYLQLADYGIVYWKSTEQKSDIQFDAHTEAMGPVNSSFYVKYGRECSRGAKATVEKRNFIKNLILN